MDTILMNSEYSKTSEPYVLILKLTDNWLHMKKHKNLINNNNKFKISATTWNDKFELPDGSYSLSDIQYHFQYFWKKNMMKRLIIHQ